MSLAAVVKTRLDVQREGHLTANTADHAYELMPVGGHGATGDRHEIDNFPNTRLGQESRHKDGGVWIVKLPSGKGLGGWSDCEVSALIMIQQRAEDAGRVEAWGAKPVDGAASRD